MARPRTPNDSSSVVRKIEDTQKRLDSVTDQLKKLMPKQEKAFHFFAERIEDENEFLEKQGKKISNVTKSFQEKMGEIASDSKKANIAELKANKDRLKNLGKAIKESVSGPEQELLESQFKEISKNLNREVKNRSAVFSSVTESIQNNFGEIASIVSGVAADSPLVAVAGKFISDSISGFKEKRKEEKERQRADLESIREQIRTEKKEQEQADSEKDGESETAQVIEKQTPFLASIKNNIKDMMNFFKTGKMKEQEMMEEEAFQNEKMLGAIKDSDNKATTISAGFGKFLKNFIGSVKNIFKIIGLGGIILTGMLLTFDKDVRKFFKDHIKEKLETVWNVLKEVGKWITENLGEPFIKLLRSIKENFKDGFSFDAVMESLKDLGGFATDVAVSIFKLGQDATAWISDQLGFENLAKNIRSIDTEKLRQDIGIFGDFVSDQLKASWEFIKETFTWSKEGILEFFGKTGTGSLLIGFIGEQLKASWQWIKDMFQWSSEGITKLVKGDLNLMGFFKDIFNAISGVLKLVFDEVKQGGKNLFSGIKNLVFDILNEIGMIFNFVFDTVSNISGKIASFFGFGSDRETDQIKNAKKVLEEEKEKFKQNQQTLSNETLSPKLRQQALSLNEQLAGSIRLQEKHIERMKERMESGMTEPLINTNPQLPGGGFIPNFTNVDRMNQMQNEIFMRRQGTGGGGNQGIAVATNNTTMIDNQVNMGQHIPGQDEKAKMSRSKQTFN